MDDDVRQYIDAIEPAHRRLFDRVHLLILEARPEAEVVLSYGMPTYRVGRSRLFVAVWKHGVSIYGWAEGRDAGFVARHPDLVSGKGTIKLRPQGAGAVSDEELRDLARSALEA